MQDGAGNAVAATITILSSHCADAQQSAST